MAELHRKLAALRHNRYFPHIIANIVHVNAVPSWGDPRIVKVALEAIKAHVQDSSVPGVETSASTLEDEDELSEVRRKRISRMERQEELVSWQAVELVLLCIIGVFKDEPGKHNHLRELALEAGTELLQDGSLQVQQRLLARLNDRRYMDFNAMIGKHILNYARDMQQRQRVLTKLVATSRIASDKHLEPEAGHVDPEDVYWTPRHDETQSPEEAKNKADTYELVRFEKEQLYDPRTRDLIPGDKQLMVRLLDFLTTMILDVNPVPAEELKLSPTKQSVGQQLQDWLRGDGQEEGTVNILEALGTCIEAFAADVDIIGLYYVEVISKLFETCRGAVLGPNVTNQQMFNDLGVMKSVATILCRHRDDFDGRLQTSSMKNGKLKDREEREEDTLEVTEEGVKQKPPRNSLTTVMKDVLDMRNAGIEFMLANVEEDTELYPLTSAVIDVSTYMLYAQVLYDIGLSLKIDFGAEVAHVTPFTTFELEKKKSVKNGAEVPWSEVFKSYGVNVLILMSKVLQASVMSSDTEQARQLTMAESVAQQRELGRMRALFQRFHDDVNLPQLFNCITTVDVIAKGKPGVFVTLVFETPEQSNILDDEFDNEKQKILHKITMDSDSNLDMCTRFCEQFALIDQEMKTIGGITLLSRYLIRHSDWFLQIATVVTCSINLLLLFFAHGTRMSSENSEDLCNSESTFDWVVCKFIGNYNSEDAKIHPTVTTALSYLSAVQTVCLVIAAYSFYLKDMTSLLNGADRQFNLTKRVEKSPHALAQGLTASSTQKMSFITDMKEDSWLKQVLEQQQVRHVLALLSDFSVIYMGVTFSCAILAQFYPFVSVVLLAGVLLRVMRTAVLVDILASITYNAIIVLFLSIITSYCYSVFIFFMMNGQMYWNGQMVCDKLYKCSLTGIWRGITMSGGIGDVLLTPNWFRQEASTEMILNLTFFILVSVIQNTIILALVTRAWSEYRTTVKRRTELSTMKCFICGADRKDFDSVEEFHEHTSDYHDPWKYMKLRIYLQNKLKVNRYSLTGLERHVATSMLLDEDPETSTREIEVLEFMPIRKRGIEDITPEDDRISIKNTLGGRKVTSLVGGITRQCTVLESLKVAAPTKPNLE